MELGADVDEEPEGPTEEPVGPSLLELEIEDEPPEGFEVLEALVEADDDDSGRAVLLAEDEAEERQCVGHEGRQRAASTADTPASTATTP